MMFYLTLLAAMVAMSASQRSPYAGARRDPPVYAHLTTKQEQQGTVTPSSSVDFGNRIDSSTSDKCKNLSFQERENCESYNYITTNLKKDQWPFWVINRQKLDQLLGRKPTNQQPINSVNSMNQKPVVNNQNPGIITRLDSSNNFGMGQQSAKDFLDAFYQSDYQHQRSQQNNLQNEKPSYSSGFRRGFYEG